MRNDLERQQQERADALRQKEDLLDLERRERVRLELELQEQRALREQAELEANRRDLIRPRFMSRETIDDKGVPVS